MKEQFDYKTLKNHYEELDADSKIMFTEQYRFILLASEEEFENYYFRTDLQEFELYSLLQVLCELENYFMLYKVVEQYHDMLQQDATNQWRREDFEEIDSLEMERINKRLHVLKVKERLGA